MKFCFALPLAFGLMALSSVLHADVKDGANAWNQGDYAKAIAEWRPLALAGDADAQFNMGQAYKLGRGVERNLVVALDWFHKAALQGQARAGDNYGLLLFEQGQQQEAMPYIRAAAERGEPRAEYVYATALFNGDLAPKDWVRAYALMTRASQAGLRQATDSLGTMDQYIPQAQRTQGLALATDLARTQAQVRAPDVSALAQPGPTSPSDGISTAVSIAPQQKITHEPTPAKVNTPAIPVTTPVKPRPAAKPTAPARTSALPAPVPSGNWWVQLGAFRKSGSAQALWHKLTQRIPGLSAFTPDYIESNGLTRLRAGPLGSSSDARQICVRIKAIGTPCVPRTK